MRGNSFEHLWFHFMLDPILQLGEMHGRLTFDLMEKVVLIDVLPFELLGMSLGSPVGQ